MKLKLISILFFLLISVSSVSAIDFEAVTFSSIPSTEPVIDRLLLVEGDTITMDAWVYDSKIHIQDDLHTTRYVKFNVDELCNILNNFNGRSVRVTHISDSGHVTTWIEELSNIDKDGYYTIELYFSEVIISGFVGYSEWNINGISGNYSLSVPNASAYNITITNNIYESALNITPLATAINYDNSGVNDFAKMRDGDTSLYSWYTLSDAGGSVGYNFSSNVTISRLSFYSLAASERVKNFTVQYVSGGAWTKVPITSVEDNTIIVNGDEGQASNADGWNTVNFNQIYSENVRVTFTDTWNIGDNNAGITEVIVYNATSPSNITATVIGDTNTSSYNYTESKSFSLTPTSTNSFVNFTTTATDYNVTVSAYWGENTTKYTETVSNGYANISVQYTPSYNITSGIINATYTLIDFSNHSYTGYPMCSVDGAIFDSNSTLTNESINVSVGFLDTSTHWINFSVAYNPPIDLYSPNDTETLQYAYPPITHDVNLSWENTTGTYRYTVTDYDTGSTISTGIAASNTTAVGLSSGHYKWYVEGYDAVLDEYGSSSNIRSFTVEDTFSYPGETVVHGVVYEYILGIKTPVETAVINIWNSTWSDSVMTGTNGYFVFHYLDNSTYSIRATKDRYLDSSIELVTPEYNTTLTRDILLQTSDGAGQQYVDHYVKFILKSLTGTLYSGVDVNIYLDDAVVPKYTGVTGTDGAISFELDENQQYRITFIDASQEISKTITLYPVNNDYTIYVFTWSYIPDDTPLQTIDYGITSASINLTAGNINASFEDTASTFTHSNFTIKAENGTVLYSFTTTDPTKDWSQVVTYTNTTTYIAVLEVFDTALTDGKIIQTAVISFKYGIRDGFDFGWSEQWQYQLFGALLILFIGGLFSATNAHFGAVIVVGIAWFNTYAGWFPATITSGLMLVLGTFLAIIFVMRKQESSV